MKDVLRKMVVVLTIIAVLVLAIQLDLIGWWNFQGYVLIKPDLILRGKYNKLSGHFYVFKVGEGWVRLRK